MRYLNAASTSSFWVDETRSMTPVTIVVFVSRSEGLWFRGASRYPTSGASVLRFCLDPPQRSVRTSAPDLRSNLPDTDCRVDPLRSRVNSSADRAGHRERPSHTGNSLSDRTWGFGYNRFAQYKSFKNKRGTSSFGNAGRLKEAVMGF